MISFSLLPEIRKYVLNKISRLYICTQEKKRWIRDDHGKNTRVRVGERLTFGFKAETSPNMEV